MIIVSIFLDYGEKIFLISQALKSESFLKNVLKKNYNFSIIYIILNFNHR